MISQQAVEYACQRVEDFAKVQQSRQLDEKLNAINILLESLGVGEEVKSVFTDWLDSFVGPGWDGAIWLGLFIGLYINEFENDV